MSDRRPVEAAMMGFAKPPDFERLAVVFVVHLNRIDAARDFAGLGN